jgi:predicted SprT family Zn-dependent metalloprotease
LREGDDMEQQEVTVQLRESWLQQATLFLFEHMQACGLTPVPVRVSCGWPSSGGLGAKRVTIGECIAPRMCADGIQQIFISPVLADSIDVLATLLHELIHAAFYCEYGHKKPFSQAARQLGLAGPPTSTFPGEQLRAFFQEYVNQVGPYPHAPIVPRVKEKKQSTRLRLYECTCAPPVKVRVASNEFQALCMRCEQPFLLVEQQQEGE